MVCRWGAASSVEARVASCESKLGALLVFVPVVNANENRVWESLALQLWRIEMVLVLEFSCCICGVIVISEDID